MVLDANMEPGHGWAPVVQFAENMLMKGPKQRKRRTPTLSSKRAAKAHA
jgi:hypothetical protein